MVCAFINVGIWEIIGLLVVGLGLVVPVALVVLVVLPRMQRMNQQPPYPQQDRQYPSQDQHYPPPPTS